MVLINTNSTILFPRNLYLASTCDGECFWVIGFHCILEKDHKVVKIIYNWCQYFLTTSVCHSTCIRAATDSECWILICSALSRELFDPVYRFGRPKNVPKNSSSTLPKSFFSDQTDHKLFFWVKFIESWTSYTLTLESSLVWPEKNLEISWKNMQQLCFLF